MHGFKPHYCCCSYIKRHGDVSEMPAMLIVDRILDNYLCFGIIYQPSSEVRIFWLLCKYFVMMTSSTWQALVLFSVFKSGSLIRSNFQLLDPGCCFLCKYRWKKIGKRWRLRSPLLSTKNEYWWGQTSYLEVDTPQMTLTFHPLFTHDHETVPVYDFVKVQTPAARFDTPSLPRLDILRPL